MTRRMAVVVAAGLSVQSFAAPENPTVNWPSFRGPQASGVAEGGRTPETWSSPKWKTPVPGLGHSSPVIWGEKLFITTAVSKKGDEPLKLGLYGDIGSVAENPEHSWQVWCLSKREGKVLWHQTAASGVPRSKRHPKATHANPTSATDGRHVVSFFGPEGLYCHDVDGKLLWKKDFGMLDSGYFVAPEAQWGFASSPVIHENRVIVQCDVQTNSFITALDVKDGRELWRTPRHDVPTWSTPAVFTTPGRTQVVANGFKEIAGYDIQSGESLWKLSNAGDIPVPTPILAHDLIFITSAHGKLSPIFVIRPEATGDITLPSGVSTNQAIVWSVSRGGNYMQTPIVYGDYLYACKDTGVVTCFNARTGEQHYNERLGSGGGGFTASPVASNGKLYFTGEQGTVHVLKAGPRFEVIARNELGESCMATPAISEGTLFFRTRGHVMAIGE